MSDFITLCQTLWEDGDLRDLNNEDLLLFKYLYACTDEELRNEMLNLENLTTVQVKQFIRH